MELNKPWLEAILTQELGKVLQWREKGENLYLPGAETENLSFEDDSSKLTVKPSRLGQTIQIHKIFKEANKESVKATLSDSKIRINAYFSSDAAREYTKKYGKDLWQDTVGGILHLANYRIRATNLGPKQDQICFYILDFKILGAEGSGPFGQMPRPIEIVGQIPEILAKFAAQRKKRDNAGSQASTRQSSPRSTSIQSPVKYQGVIEEVHTQPDATTFATQAPKARLLDVSAKLTTNLPPNGLGKSILVPRSTNSEKRTTPAVNNVKQLSNAELLKSFGKPQPNPTATAAPMPPIPSTTNPSSSGHPAIDNPVQPTLRQTESSASMQTISADLKSSIHTHASPSPPPKSEPKLEAVKQRTAQSPKPASPPIEHPSPLKLSETLASSQVRLIAVSTAKNSPRTVDLDTKQRRRRGRISMRDIRISQDQSDLLNRPDSWLPAEPGHREPVGNIPLSILNTLNAKADRRAERASLSKDRHIGEPKLPMAANGNTTPSPLSSPVEEREDPIPWSPSPNRLPLDSSRPCSGGSDRVVERLDSVNGVRANDFNHETPASHVFGLASPQSQKEAENLIEIEEQSQKDDSAVVGNLSDDERASLDRLETQRFNDADEEIPNTKLDSSYSAEDFSYTADLEPKANLSDESISGEKSPIADALSISADLSGHTGIPSAEDRVVAEEVPSRDLELTNHDPKIPSPDTSHFSSSQASSDSELEEVLPCAMGDEVQHEEGNDSPQELPSTAVQNQIPFTQVKETPYPNGLARKRSRSKSDDEPSSSGNLEHSRISATTLESLCDVRPSESTAPESSLLVLNGMMNGRQQVQSESTDSSLAAQPPGKGKDGQVNLKHQLRIDSNVKRRDVAVDAESPRPIKRPKLSEFFPRGGTQDIVSPSDMANQSRRDFFSRRSSANSVQISNPPSPAKNVLREASGPISKFQRPGLPKTIPSSWLATNAAISEAKPVGISEEETRTSKDLEGDCLLTTLQAAVDNFREHGRSPVDTNSPEILRIKPLDDSRNLEIETRLPSQESAQIDIESSDREESPFRNSKNSIPNSAIRDPAEISIPSINQNLEAFETDKSAPEQTQHECSQMGPNETDMDGSKHESHVFDEGFDEGDAPTELSNRNTEDLLVTAVLAEEHDGDVQMVNVDGDAVASEHEIPTIKDHEEQRLDTQNAKPPSSPRPPLIHVDIDSEDVAEGAQEGAMIQRSQRDGSDVQINERKDLVNWTPIDRSERFVPEQRRPMEISYKYDHNIAEAKHTEETIRSQKISEPPITPESWRLPYPNKDPTKTQQILWSHSEHPSKLIDRFKLAYPDYLGDQKHLRSLCLRIQKLVESGGCLPRFLWDDFIIRHKTEYPTYLKQCAEDAEDPLIYEKYYVDVAGDALYTEKIVTAQNLHEALGLEIAASASALQVRQDGIGGKAEASAAQPIKYKAQESLVDNTIDLMRGQANPGAQVLPSNSDSLVQDQQATPKVQVEALDDVLPIMEPISDAENLGKARDGQDHIHKQSVNRGPRQRSFGELEPTQKRRKSPQKRAAKAKGIMSSNRQSQSSARTSKPERPARITIDLTSDDESVQTPESTRRLLGPSQTDSLSKARRALPWSNPIESSKAIDHLPLSTNTSPALASEMDNRSVRGNAQPSRNGSHSSASTYSRPTHPIYTPSRSKPAAAGETSRMSETSPHVGKLLDVSMTKHVRVGQDKRSELSGDDRRPHKKHEAEPATVKPSNSKENSRVPPTRYRDPRPQERRERDSPDVPTGWWQDPDNPYNTFVRNYAAIVPGSGNSYADPAEVTRARALQKKQQKFYRQSAIHCRGALDGEEKGT